MDARCLSTFACDEDLLIGGVKLDKDRGFLVEISVH